MRVVKWTSLPCAIVFLAFCAIAVVDGDGLLAVLLAVACAGSVVSWLRPDAGIWPRTPPNESLVQQIARGRRARRRT